MRRAVSCLLVGLVLIAGADLMRRAATLEDAVASAQQRLTTGDHPESADPPDASWMTWLPVIGPSIDADLRHTRALALYWRGDYATLIANDRNKEPADATVQLISANAMFRDLVGRPLDGPGLGHALDAVMKSYLTVLEANPGAVDAAFNYEFVSRLRAAVGAGRNSGIPVPARSNMHGQEGSPPKQVKPSDFNIIVPLRPDERQEQSDPQSGSKLQRKG